VRLPRQEMTGADRRWAVQYEPGDILRYTRGSKSVGVQSGEYVRVAGVDREENLLTIKRENGRHLILLGRSHKGRLAIRVSHV